jgi:hypothetical protein
MFGGNTVNTGGDCVCTVLGFIADSEATITLNGIDVPF